MSLIAGIFGIVAAVITITIGGVASAFESGGGQLASMLGFIGAGVSALVLVFGALALGMPSRWNGVALVLLSLIGAVLGGNLVAFCMIVSLVGGGLIVAGGGQTKAAPEAGVGSQETPTSLRVPTTATDLPPNASTSSLNSETSKQSRPASNAVKNLVIGSTLAVGTLGILLVAVPLLLRAEETKPTQFDFNQAVMGAFPVRTTATFGQVEFQINDVQIRDEVGTEFFVEDANAGEVFIAMTYAYKNAGSTALSASDKPELRLIDASGGDIKSDVGVSSAFATENEGRQNLISDINPGVSQNGSTVFVIGEEHFQNNNWLLKVTIGADTAFIDLFDQRVSAEESVSSGEGTTSSELDQIGESTVTPVKLISQKIDGPKRERLTALISPTLLAEHPTWKVISSIDVDSDRTILLLETPLSTDEIDDCWECAPPLSIVDIVGVNSQSPSLSDIAVLFLEGGSGHGGETSDVFPVNLPDGRPAFAFAWKYNWMGSGNPGPGCLVYTLDGNWVDPSDFGIVEFDSTCVD